MHAEPQRDSADRAIGRLAERQHGVVSRAQLSELGLGAGAIKHRVEIGRLRPVYRGVYTIGHELLTRNGRWEAAVLAFGPGAVLSYRAAAALWGVRGGSPVEITVPGARHRRPGILVHRAKLPADETTTHFGIPTTTVPRTRPRHREKRPRGALPSLPDRRGSPAPKTKRPRRGDGGRLPLAGAAPHRRTRQPHPPCRRVRLRSRSCP